MKDINGYPVFLRKDYNAYGQEKKGTGGDA